MIQIQADKTKRTVKSGDLLGACYRKVDGRFWRLVYALSQQWPAIPLQWIAKSRYRAHLHRWPGLKNPQSFNEKLLWLTLYWRHPLRRRCADKYALRSYAEEHGFGHLLAELYGVYEHSSEIDFGALPERFVLKCNHGSGFNVVCRDKRSLDREDTKRRLNAWMTIDYSRNAGESEYAGIKRRIICERFLEQPGADLPTDYKVYCFGGRANCILVCTERVLNGTAKFDFYDRDWNEKLSYLGISDRDIPKPEAHHDIITSAEALSKPFPFVRMDFYSTSGRAVLGEMTFSPAGCTYQHYTAEAQKHLGALIKLPERFP
jgi:hypothetical protein